MSTEPARSGWTLELRDFLGGPRLRRRVSCPNPFYLLSAACFIHATGIPLQAEGHPLSPEGLLGLIAGYAAILAAIAFVIVRLWKVWDDARSIFMILLLLFLELALCADSTLQADPGRGARLLVVGLGVAAAISEFVLRGLRLKLPASYRLPYYAQLAVLFLYPLWLLPTLKASDVVGTTWRIFAFPFVVGLSILLLWPAVRRGPRAVENNGSPWQWGWYPWTLFVFLGFCLCLRSYTLCLSFDAATALKFAAAYRLENIFGLYFLAPVLLAAAVLVLEAGVQSGRREVQWWGLAIPAAGGRLVVAGDGSECGRGGVSRPAAGDGGGAGVVGADGGGCVLCGGGLARSGGGAAGGGVQSRAAGRGGSVGDSESVDAVGAPAVAAAGGGGAGGGRGGAAGSHERLVRGDRTRGDWLHAVRAGGGVAGAVDAGDRPCAGGGAGNRRCGAG
ncbi:MAG: hypothetical protein U0992_19530 [Planctomycetaceae bacterium]